MNTICRYIKVTALIQWLMEGTGYEVRQASKEQPKMPRFMLEGPRSPQSFGFRWNTMHELRNQYLHLVSSTKRSKQLHVFCFVHGKGQKRQQKHTTKNFDEFHNHTPLLTMLILLCRSLAFYWVFYLKRAQNKIGKKVVHFGGMAAEQHLILGHMSASPTV